MKEQKFETGYYFEIKLKYFGNELQKVEGFIIGGNSVVDVVKKTVIMLNTHFKNCYEAPLIVLNSWKILNVVSKINNFQAEHLKKDIVEKNFDVWAVQLLSNEKKSYPDTVLNEIFKNE